MKDKSNAGPVQEQMAALRRTQILEAAAQVFAEKGFHPSTIRDVAKAAGVADGTIYNYFENKSALLLGLFDQMTERARAEVDPAALAQADLRELVRLYLSGPLRAMGEGNAELFRVVISEVMVNPEVRTRFSGQLLAPMLQLGEGVFARSAVAAGRDPATAALQVRVVSGLVLGLLLSRLIGDETLRDGWDTLPDELADLLVAGFAGGYA